MDNIKLNGHWEDVETPYIKENGHWVASDDQYIKVGGHWSDTKDLSSTKLDYDMTIGKEPDSSRYLVNDTATYGITDNSNPYQNIKGAGNTCTFDTNTNTFAVKLVSAENHSWLPSMGLKQVFAVNNMYKFTTVITVTSGQCKLKVQEYGRADGSNVTNIIYNELLTVGTYTKTFEGNVRTDGSATLMFDGVAEHTCEFTVHMEVKKILTGNSKNLYKAPLHSGHSVALTGDGVIDVPINATLGSELPYTTRGAYGGVTLTGDTISSDGAGTEKAGRYYYNLNAGTGAAGKILVKLMASNIVGTPNIAGYMYHDGGTVIFDKPINIIDGVVEIECNIRPTHNDIILILDNSIVSSFDVVDGVLGTSIKEITTVQGSITTFDYADNKFKQNKALLLSATYQLKDGKYGITCKLHEHHFSDADISALNASPELLVAWYFGTETLPSGIVKQPLDKVWYPV